MKSIWREIVMAVIMGMILPNIVLHWAVEDREPEQEERETRPAETQIQEIQLEMSLRSGDGTVMTMNMDDYLVGVLLAEMPANFEQEAKKAQAVVARTYTRKAAVTGGKHGDGSVCTSASCCQAYISESEYINRGGSEAEIESARSAVLATSGYVLTYEGELIEATYFSCSGGSTEDAVAVWGTDFPYLRATDSPGEEYATHYTDTVSFTKQQFEDVLGVVLSGTPETWIGTATYTAGGGVNTILIGGMEFKGTQLRSALGLRSTAFTIDADEEKITITTKGFGHRVGLSQYGADAMAATGSSYQEILAHYYRGTTLELTKADS